MQKKKTFRSKAYLEYVRSLPCIICRMESVPHHEIGGGISLKGSDLYAIPLCNTHHQELHSKGVKTFWKKNNLNRWEIIAETLAGYIERREDEDSY